MPTETQGTQIQELGASKENRSLDRASLLDVFLGKESGETLTPAFTNVVFGHSFADFDLDQLLTYYFALKLGVVSPTAPFLFTSDVHAKNEEGKSHFEDPATLVIEGFGHVPEDTIHLVREKRKNGNFANGLKGEPAASELLREFQSRLGQIDVNSKKGIRNLENWLKAGEKDEKELKGFVKNFPTVKLLKPIFYGLKQKYPEETPESSLALLVELITVLQIIIADTSEEKLREQYAEVINAGSSVEIKNKAALRERLNNPATFKHITTLQNVSITYFDIRGLGVSKGAAQRARSKSHPDILVLIDDQYDPSNTNTVLGTQYKIFVEKNIPFIAGENKDLLSILHDRMQLAEAQFGKGYRYSEVRSFGSHAALVDSPQSAGSDIDPMSMWRSIQHFFDYPRYSVENLKQKAAQLAAQLDTEQYAIAPLQPSESKYHFGNRAITFTIKTPEGMVTTTLSEEDLPYYEPLLTDNIEENRRLLLQRTTVSEPPAVIAARTQQLHEWTTTYLKAKDAGRLLELLSTVNETSITSLPLKQKIAILATIATDPQSISHIWDKNNLTFSLIDARLPEEIQPYMEQYKLNRYKLKSLAHSIDTTLVNNSIAEVLTSKDQSLQQAVAETLLSILQSETYKTSHTEDVYDSLLQNLLFFANELYFFNKQLAMHIIATIESAYGETMRAHWNQVDPSYRDVLSKNFPDSALVALIPEGQTETIPGLAGSKMKPFSTDATLERMIETGNKTMTFLVEVTRPIETKVMRSQFETSSGELAPLEALDAHFSCGSFNLDEAEYMKLVAALLPSLRTAIKEVLATDNETKLRIIQGGFINILTGQMHEHITEMLFEIFEEMYPQDTASELRRKVQDFKQHRLVWASHNRATDTYQDSAFFEVLG